MIVCVGLSHKDTPIEVREQLAIGDADVPAVIGELLQHELIAETAVLSTCNRVEVYAALPRGIATDSGHLEKAAAAVTAVLAARGGPAVKKSLKRSTGTDAISHLFRVASSLDSLVVGEPQILGQLKGAIALATEHRAVGPVLSKALRRALHVGKRVRSETQIGAGQVSVSSVAVELACQIFGDLADRSALLVGAGEMAESAAKLLVKEGARLSIINRSRDRAQRLAEEVGGEPRDWSSLSRCLVEADIVITSTSSPTFVITEEAMRGARKARRGRNVFFIDIAVPRDVDPAVNSLDGVYLYDIDDLSQIVSDSLAGRAVEAEKAERIVASEVTAFEGWRAEQTMTPAIVGLRARIRAVLHAEVERSLSGKLKHLTEADREALSIMVDAATNKLCHRPSTRLKELATDPRGVEYVEALTDLFDLPALFAGHDEGDRASEDGPRGARDRAPMRADDDGE
jgi:glutamyl-tRNA reductase